MNMYLLVHLDELIVVVEVCLGAFQQCLIHYLELLNLLALFEVDCFVPTCIVNRTMNKNLICLYTVQMTIILFGHSTIITVYIVHPGKQVERCYTTQAEKCPAIWLQFPVTFQFSFQIFSLCRITS